MPKKEYNWDNGPAELAPHSLAKHTILREYVERYISILTRSGTLPNLRVTLVDGFAGGGEYFLEGERSRIREGSPLILIRAVHAATTRINDGRKKLIDVNADFVFVEKNDSAFKHLKGTLARHFDKIFLDEKVRCIHGPFEAHVWDIVEKIKSSPGRKSCPIFVLDQYGYSNVPIDMIARIMSEFDRPEIFLTLAVEHISAYAGSMGEALSRLRSSLHIDPRVDDLLQGRKEIDELGELPEEDRSRIMLQVQQLLHQAFATQAGARYYTPFFITSRGSNRSFWFLHLANSAKANDVVKDLHWETANHFQHHGRPGTKMLTLGFDPAKEEKQMSFDFGDSAKDRTVNALIEELPELIRSKYPDGISFEHLYEVICSDTPASKSILGASANDLCAVGELAKAGANGEKREALTILKDDDVVRLAHQGRLFSIPELRKKR